MLRIRHAFLAAKAIEMNGNVTGRLGMRARAYLSATEADALLASELKRWRVALALLAARPEGDTLPPPPPPLLMVLARAKLVVVVGELGLRVSISNFLMARSTGRLRCSKASARAGVGAVGGSRVVTLSKRKGAWSLGERERKGVIGDVGIGENCFVIVFWGDIFDSLLLVSFSP